MENKAHLEITMLFCVCLSDVTIGIFILSSFVVFSLDQTLSEF